MVLVGPRQSGKNTLLKHLYGVSESLAGRAAVLELLPMSRWEINHQPQKKLPWEGGKPVPTPAQPSQELWEHILRGSYPEIISNPDRDVRNLRNIGDLTLFQTFLRALAARSGKILNLSDLAKDVGVSVNTAKDWISILETSFQAFILRPYYANIGKRLVKSPKVYFTDTGLLCYLVGLRDTEYASSGPMGRAIFENLVVAEMFKIYIHQGEEPALYHWRTSAGSEVDLVVETQDQLIPIETKLSETPRPETAREIVNFQKDFEGKVGQGYVVHPGQMTLPLGKGIMSLPLANM